MFLGWFDDSSGVPPHSKIAEGIGRYVMRFGDQPNLVLVNQADVTTFEGVEVRAVEYVRPNHFWVGRVESLVEVER